MAAQATDHAALRDLNAQLAAVAGERDELEAAWLDVSEALEGSA